MSDPLDLHPDHVAAYLRRHNSFLQDYPELAATLVLPRESGAATSLTSYQLEILREKNRAMSSRLKDLVAVAEDNQALVGRVHQFALRLLRAPGFRDTVLAIAASLREDFGTDLVSLWLVGLPRLKLGEPWLTETQADDPALLVFRSARSSGEPLCGRLGRDKLALLFGDQAESIGSAVLLPLGELGFLGIGSADPNRFHPGMGTLFLRQMAELAEAAIATAASRG
jgi:uncharacterized protein YigA (DUF484 family)